MTPKDDKPFIPRFKIFSRREPTPAPLPDSISGFFGSKYRIPPPQEVEKDKTDIWKAKKAEAEEAKEVESNRVKNEKSETSIRIEAEEAKKAEAEEAKKAEAEEAKKAEAEEAKKAEAEEAKEVETAKELEVEQSDAWGIPDVLSGRPVRLIYPFDLKVDTKPKCDTRFELLKEFVILLFKMGNMG